MGVRHLETFIKQYVPDGFVDISLVEECEEFKRKNGTKPTLVVDLMGLLYVRDPIFRLCGLRHNKIYNKVDDLFSRLNEIAELVFFVDGPVQQSKGPEWIRRQKDAKERAIRISNKVYFKKTCEEILSNERDLPSSIPHRKLVTSIAKKYARIFVSVERECDLEMAQFACRNERVLAILADDSDFLIYPGQWRYFSLREMNQETLVTKEYSRVALREFLNLNDEELVLLSTLNGNDFVHFEDTFCFRKSLTENHKDASERFPAIAEFIKNSSLLQEEDRYSKIAAIISSEKNLTYDVQNSFESYDVNLEPPVIPDDEELRYCLEKNLCVYVILKHLQVTHTTTYFDLRRSDSYFKTMKEIFQRQLGIVLKHKPFKNYEFEICTKQHYMDDEFVFLLLSRKEMEGLDQPPLLELLNRSDYPQHDDIRFKLFKWLINDEKMKDVDLESLTQRDEFIDVSLLVFMVCENLIDIKEADILLLTIKLAEDEANVPDDLKPPEVLHPRAFFISYLFSKMYDDILRCLEYTGLKEFVKYNRLDSVLFQNLYPEYIDSPREILPLLGDLVNSRYYAF